MPTPEASTQPADEEEEEQGGIGLHVLPRVRPPPRLARTPTHKMTREHHATFTTAIATSAFASTVASSSFTSSSISAAIAAAAITASIATANVV